MSNRRREYTVTWFIENYSYCWHSYGQGLKSPEFTPDWLRGSVYYLKLFPRGTNNNNKGMISFILCRRESDACSENFTLKFELSILGPDRSSLISKIMEFKFSWNTFAGEVEFAKMEDVLLNRKNDFLPEDILCVRCKIWMGEGNILSSTQVNAVTRIEIKHVSFLHVVDDFSALKPMEKKTTSIASPIGGEPLSSSVHFFELCFNGTIVVEIISPRTDLLLRKCKLSLVDKYGKQIECCDADNRFSIAREDIKTFRLSLSRTAILNRKNEYLPGDKLSLLCDCTFSHDVELQKLEKIPHCATIGTLNTINNFNQTKVVYNVTEQLSACSNALDDLKRIYSDLFLTDVELKTKTKSFPAHKILLSARSSVFKAMLTTNMKEKIMNSIQVDDLENETVQQLLLFLYSDKLENLDWESALKLYYAGDKYDVKKLKVLCASFLVENVSPSTVPKLLLLADMHDDSDLRKFAEHFILEHEEEIYGSDEWEKLMEINPSLVFKMMCLKYKREDKSELNINLENEE